MEMMREIGRGRGASAESSGGRMDRSGALPRKSRPKKKKDAMIPAPLLYDLPVPTNSPYVTDGCASCVCNYVRYGKLTSIWHRKITYDLDSPPCSGLLCRYIPTSRPLSSRRRHGRSHNSFCARLHDSVRLELARSRESATAGRSTG